MDIDKSFSSSDGLIHTEYYQHETPPTNVAGELLSWRMTDFGNVGEFSRDGSVHATDEVFNAASHLAALILSLLGSAILIVEASAQGEPWKIVSFCIYGASLCFLFSASTLHHAIEGPWEGFLRMLDYFAIYPLIAGTFTPLCLVFYHDQPVGWTFFGTIWSLSLLGMLLTASCFSKVPKWFSMTLYISLGWLGACFSYWVSMVVCGDNYTTNYSFLSLWLNFCFCYSIISFYPNLVGSACSF
jgi:hemolysin III